MKLVLSVYDDGDTYNVRTNGSDIEHVAAAVLSAAVSCGASLQRIIAIAKQSKIADVTTIGAPFEGPN